jgi:hypothetical protein
MSRLPGRGEPIDSMVDRARTFPIPSEGIDAGECRPVSVLLDKAVRATPFAQHVYDEERISCGPDQPGKAASGASWSRAAGG